MTIISLKTRLAEFFKAVALLHQVMSTVYKLLNDKPVPSTHPCAWLVVLSKQELLLLTQDVERSLRNGFFTGDWTEVPAAVKFWYNTATAQQKSLKKFSTQSLVNSSDE